jgi:hypothetical protein
LTWLAGIASDSKISFIMIVVLPTAIVVMGLIIWKKLNYSINPIDLSTYGRSVQILRDPIGSIEQTVPLLNEDRIRPNPIRILSGEAIYSAMGNSEIVNWIERAHKLGNEIKIIAGPNIDSKTVHLLDKWIKEGIIEFHYSKKRASRHFRIFGDHIYLEMPHRPNARRRTALNISGANSELRGRLVNEFEALWNDTVLVTSSRQMETLIKRN